ncbi:Sodium/hydrogen exchanger family [seawater metagenome]|uniref:Sodium/hydrogen exchanger family n=1 Tax=seawater metagenome TaxID=1561972 RepID=A0A5E8CK82_9ZZZZ
MQGNFMDFIYVSIFLLSICLVRRTFLFFNICPLIGDIINGIIFGPNVLNLVPFKDAFIFLGYFGLLFLILESGIDFNLEKIKSKYKITSLIALLGILMPFGLSLLLIYLLCNPDNLFGFLLAAFSIAPTSIGLSLKVLEENKKLDSDFGQLIISIAICDDIIAIIGFSIFNNLLNRSNEIGILIVLSFLPIIFSILGAYLAYKIWPQSINKILTFFKNKQGIHFEIHEQIVSFCFFILALIYGTIGHFIGSELLGVFFAGLSFSRVDNIHKIWKHQVKRLAKWLSIIFFSATIGFSIPINAMFNLEAFGIGIIIFIISGIICKITAPYLLLNEYKTFVGFALVARGELSFIMADFAFQKNLIDDFHYAILMWVFLLSAFCSPIVLNYLIKKINNKEKQDYDNNDNTITEIRITGAYHHNMIDDILDILEEISYEVISSIMYKHGEKSNEIIKVKNKAEIIPNEVIKELILKAIGDRTELVEINTQELEIIDELNQQITLEIKGINGLTVFNEFCQKLHVLDLEPFTIFSEILIVEQIIKILIKKRTPNNFDIWVKKIRELLDDKINDCQIDLEIIP